jgi:DNA-binding SARP family transcriptional activator/TolB-like protein
LNLRTPACAAARLDLAPTSNCHSGEASVAVQLVTFGGLHVVDDAGELERLLAQRSRAALFIYLVVERRVSRESLAAMFWPESDAENARHALRQSLYHLRRAIGDREWIDSRAHELVVRDDVRADATLFTDAVERGDTELAVRLYRGPFLDGVHLVDLKPWETWVDGRRSQYARAFRKACRDLVETKRTAGDQHGAIAAAERWVACDASDDEAQHRLIQALAAAGERAEAIRQYEMYARVLEPDGLEPLDETRELVERLRAESARLPTTSVSTGAVPRSVSHLPEILAPSAPTTEAFRRPRWMRSRTAVALVLIGALGAVWVWRATSFARSPMPSTTAIAVLPFSVRGDEAVRYLGDGIVNLLTTALDGAGSLRPVDARATFAAIAEAGDAATDPRHGARVAARLGAGMFVLGDVIESGGVIHLEAAVYDGEARCSWFRRVATGGGCAVPRPNASAVVSGRADSVFALVDALAARLLAGLGDPAAHRLTRTAALTTTSLPAFKAYLQGEDEMRAGRFERAADDYLVAIGLDSTFAVAHYRLSLAREWAPLPGIEDAAHAAARHGARLATRDRRLLEALVRWRAGDGTQAEQAYRTILARYPDDIDAWLQLGEIQFHHGPLLGRPLEGSEAAWRSVLSYEPRNLFAITHFARIAAANGRITTLDSLVARFSDQELRTDRRLEEPAILRALARGDTAAARSLARFVRRGETYAVFRVAAFLTAFSVRPSLTRGVVEELSHDFPSAGVRADMHWLASLLDLAVGRVAASSVARARAVEAERAAPAAVRRPGFDPVTEWFAATLPLPYADSTLARIRGRVESARVTPAGSRGPFVGEFGTGAPIQIEPLRHYTLGILSARLGDSAAAASAAATLHRLAASANATTLVRDLDRGLRARLAWEQGRPEEALRLLESLESGDWQGEVTATPFVSRANERFLRGEVLAALGRDAEALAWFTSVGIGTATEIPVQALSHLRQGQVHERLRNRAEAARHYARFIELWGDADPEFRSPVDSVRARLATLEHRE